MAIKTDRKSYLAIGAVLLIIFGLFIFQQSKGPSKNNSRKTPTIKYIGPTVRQEIVDVKTKKPSASTALVKPGTTALELLEKTTAVKMKGEGTTAYVTDINGITANTSKKEYWAFSINGKLASVGAGSYQLKDKDIIRWEIKNY